MGVELAEAYVSIIPSARGIKANVEKELEPVGDAASKVGDEAGEGFLKKFGAKLGAGIAIVGTTAAGLLAKGFADAIDIEAANDKMAAQLGLSGEQAAAFGKASADLYRNAYGESIDEVNGALVAVESTLANSLGNSESALSDVTAMALNFASAFDVDVNRAVNSAGIAVSSGLAGDATEAFDLITASAQQVPSALREDFLDATDEYSQFFSALGFSGEQAFGLLVDASAEGMYGIDKTGDAIKEFGIRATDMSTLTKSAYDAIGVSQDEITDRFLAGGDIAKGAFDEVVNGLLSIEDPGTRANAAIALFGTPLEDLGVNDIPAFLEGLAGVGDGLGDVAGAADEMGKTLSDNTASKIEAFKRKALGALADFVAEHVIPVVERLVAWISDHWPEISAVAERVFAAVQRAIDWVRVNVIPKLVEAVQAVVAWVRDHWPEISAVVQQVLEAVRQAIDAVVVWIRDHWPEIQQVISDVLATVQEVIQGAIDFITTIWENFGAQILQYVEGTWNQIRGQIEGALQIIRGIIEVVTSLIKGDWSGVWDGIKQILEGVWTAMVATIEGAIEKAKALISVGLEIVGSIFSAAWDGIKSAAVSAFDTVITWFTELPGRILGALGDLGSLLWGTGLAVINGLWEGLKLWWDFVLSWFDGLPILILGALKDAATWLVDVGKKIIKGLYDGIVSAPFDIAKAIADKIPGAGIVKGGISIGGDVVSSLNPFRAKGGPTSAGKPYIVGEEGWELFVPNSSGTVIDHDTSVGLLSGGGSRTGVHIERAVLSDLTLDALMRSANFHLAAMGV